MRARNARIPSIAISHFAPRSRNSGSLHVVPTGSVIVVVMMVVVMMVPMRRLDHNGRTPSMVVVMGLRQLHAPAKPV
jgi:hypothetical protein